MQQLIPHQTWLQDKNKSIQNEWNNVVFIQKTIAQIDKDFSGFTTSNMAENIDFKSDIKEAIIKHIKQNLDLMERDSPSLIPQLIYLIDLPESIFQSIMQHSRSINHDLAQCILIREAYKVWMRSQYE